jgi:hypothetical protein
VLLAASLSDKDAKTQRKRSCEIDFYLGSFDLEKGMRDEARRRLQAAADICVPGEIEFVAAKAELAGIGSNR